MHHHVQAIYQHVRTCGDCGEKFKGWPYKGAVVTEEGSLRTLTLCKKCAKKRGVDRVPGPTMGT